MTREELSKLIYDPSLIKKKILDYIAEFNNGERVVSDPTNPFVMLLEAAAAESSAAALECNNILRKKYPSLANKEDDLYVHITDNELTNMFSVPAELEITIYVNIADLQRNGLRPENANFYETTIPKYTTFTILEIPFTLLNDIVVRLYDNNNIFVEMQLNNNNDMAYNNFGTLEASYYSGSESTPWIVFTTKVKQLKRLTKTKTIVSSEGFKDDIGLTDKYCYSNVSYANNYTDGNYVYLTKAHNEEYIDPQKPTVFISVYDKNIIFKIPDVYLVDGNVSGNVLMEVYETKGKLYLPVNKYTTTDWTVELGDISSSTSAATSADISIFALSTDIINGGVDGYTLDDLRTSIINNTTGVIELPITDKQLEKNAQVNGYAVFKEEDVVTHRLYLALRSLPDFNSSLVFAKQDVFFNTCNLTISEIINYDSVIVNDGNFIIKSNSIFKEKNGMVTLCSPDEIKFLNKLPNLKLIDHISTNKYFYNPYYYVINSSETYTESRVYDFDNPEVKNHRILEKNLNVTPRVNINKYDIFKVENGYRIEFTLANNDEFKTLSVNTIKIRASIELYNGQELAYLDAAYDDVNKNWFINVSTTFNIDNNDLLDLTNGESVLATKRINLVNKLIIYTATTDIGLQDPTNQLVSEFNKPELTHLTVFTKEELVVVFGNKLDYIFNKLYSVYSGKKYKTYDHDYPLVYEEDVYDIDPNTGAAFDVTGTGAAAKLVYNILHHKGEPVLDVNGEQVYKYRKGDTVLDTNGEPVIDTTGGIIRYIDLLLLEYEFFRANSPAYLAYKKTVTETLNKYIISDMKTLNEKLLDNTKLVYKSFKTSKSVNVIVNKSEETIPYMVTPHVVLYLKDTTSITNDTLENYKNIIGNIINKHLDKTVIRLDDIKEDIKNGIGTTVSGVKITNLDPTNAEVLTIKNENIKLTLNKQLTMNKNSEFVVKYNIKLDIQYI